MSISDKKAEANRNNAQKSTGPKTDEGKAISRRNALKHGFCAKILDVPGEDPAEVAEQTRLWQAELNPNGSVVAGYLVNVAVRHARVLDRLHNVENARYANRLRDAKRVKKNRRLRSIERAKDHFVDRPDKTLRLLRKTPEGVALLINRWESFVQMLSIHHPAEWDHEALSLMDKLTTTGWGIDTRVYSVPRKFFMMTSDINLFRKTFNDVKLYEKTGMCHPAYRFSGEVDVDRNYMEDYGPMIKNHCAEILGVVNDHLAELRDLKVKLDAEEVVDDDLIGREATFDGSESGKLIQKYKHENERGLLRSIHGAQSLAADVREAGESDPQPVGVEPLTQGKPFTIGAIVTGPATRNEATPGVKTDPDLDFSVGRNAPKPTKAKGRDVRKGRNRR